VRLSLVDPKKRDHIKQPRSYVNSGFTEHFIRSNENTNGRIRRFWPKKIDRAKFIDQEIDNRILLLNLTPRKVLGDLTPLEVFIGRRVALIN
jgi:hypothetical protein